MIVDTKERVTLCRTIGAERGHEVKMRETTFDWSCVELTRKIFYVHGNGSRETFCCHVMYLIGLFSTYGDWEVKHSLCV